MIVDKILISKRHHCVQIQQWIATLWKYLSQQRLKPCIRYDRLLFIPQKRLKFVRPVCRNPNLHSIYVPMQFMRLNLQAMPNNDGTEWLWKFEICEPVAEYRFCAHLRFDINGKCGELRQLHILNNVAGGIGIQTRSFALYGAVRTNTNSPFQTTGFDFTAKHG